MFSPHIRNCLMKTSVAQEAIKQSVTCYTRVYSLLACADNQSSWRPIRHFYNARTCYCSFSGIITFQRIPTIPFMSRHGSLNRHNALSYVFIDRLKRAWCKLIFRFVSYNMLLLQWTAEKRKPTTKTLCKSGCLAHYWFEKPVLPPTKQCFLEFEIHLR